jgi:hypothetical protein
MSEPTETAAAPVSRKRAAEDDAPVHSAEDRVVSEAKKAAPAGFSVPATGFSFSPALFSFSFPTGAAGSQQAASLTGDAAASAAPAAAASSAPSAFPFAFSFPTASSGPVGGLPGPAKKGDDDEGNESGGGEDDQVYGSVAGDGGDPTAGGPSLVLPEKPKSTPVLDIRLFVPK